jgi:broad specificity phosphatase PhoE/ribonuclease HI
VSPARVVVEADGGSRGNPGPAGYGAVVLDPATGAVLAERAEFLGTETNNVAEYGGLIAGLSAALELGAGEVEVRMDSKLVVEQMSGRWQVKHPGLRPLHAQASALAARFGLVSYTWIPRAQNARADRLANQAMDRGAVAQPARVAQPADAARPTEPPEPAEAARLGEAAAAVRPENNNTAWISAGFEPTRLILVRHGVTEYSVSRRFAGRSDLDLTEDGVAQAAAAAGRVAALGPVHALYSSPLVRTRHTAAIIGDRLGLPAGLEPGLTETDYGDWDGYTFAELQQRWPAELARWLSDPTVAPPGGESQHATTLRAAAARDTILGRHPGRTVVAVSHVSPIKALVQLALGAPPAAVHRMFLAPASVSVIDYFTEGPVSLRAYNDTSHLD